MARGAAATGRLELPDYVKLVFDLAKKNNKRVGLRIQMSAPDYKHQPALPDFVLDKVPTVELVPDEKEKKAAARFIENQYSRYQPRFDHPFFQQAFAELVGLLSSGIQWQSRYRIRRHLSIWILGRGAHLALRQYSFSRLPNRGEDLGQDDGSAAGALHQDSADDQHPTRLQSSRQFRGPRSHDSQPQLDSQRHHLH